jgi:hypothetical protein
VDGDERTRTGVTDRGDVSDDRLHCFSEKLQSRFLLHMNTFAFTKRNPAWSNPYSSPSHIRRPGQSGLLALLFLGCVMYAFGPVRESVYYL